MSGYHHHAKHGAIVSRYGEQSTGVVVSDAGRGASIRARRLGVSLNGEADQINVVYHLPMRLRLIRHATLILEYAGHTLLIDPMLDEVGARPPIENSPNPRDNPLVPLPIPAREVLQGVEAVLVTHTHSDHWDASAAKLIPKDLPLYGQPEDEAKFRAQGFTQVNSIPHVASWKGIEFTRTGGQHGTGTIAKLLAPASGFVLRAAGKPTLYLAGDTIWCVEVERVLTEFQPAVTVVNTGAARFLEGGSITMTADDVITVCQRSPKTCVVAVHMEAINHCLLTRDDLAFQLEAARVEPQVKLPNDGDWITFSREKRLWLAVRNPIIA
jgi:L-ascorbate metabolism protein UlaG (beta-lactamase superfamily)